MPVNNKIAVFFTIGMILLFCGSAGAQEDLNTEEVSFSAAGTIIIVPTDNGCDYEPGPYSRIETPEDLSA